MTLDKFPTLNRKAAIDLKRKQRSDFLLEASDLRTTDFLKPRPQTVTNNSIFNIKFKGCQMKQYCV